ncbi:hypothetical protein IW261DRAFT_1012366 [Armillaria novae-zelandiae]|uniref:Uncharacterized protein n=1 Tax=Armillaria novae-zelandiae TaxID=153914 RepID=A0AA39U1J2_9AGAR|nr:hypothetical protein IW261DRAFT_1012366 [Armillaria novae-zelandiae]
MQSYTVTLPSFDELLQSLNGQNPPPLFGSRVQHSTEPTCVPPPVNGQYPWPQPNVTSAPPPVNVQHPPPQFKTHSKRSKKSPLPIITVNQHGHQKIPGPLGPKHQWLKKALGAVHENCPPGNYYALLKHSEPYPPREKDEYSASGCCSLIKRGGPIAQFYIKALKTRGRSYTVYLHRPKSDDRENLPVLKSIPFISSDPSDQELGLPGVSMPRLLATEPGILADSNSVILNAESLWPTACDWCPLVRVKGQPIVKSRCYNSTVECKHAVLTHLGLAYSLAADFFRIFDHNLKEKWFDFMRLRLVALYTVDPSRVQWNVAYAIVDP